jgi:2,3-bisphosphoglycerate-dependent phosphoglycerate mutase
VTSTLILMRHGQSTWNLSGQFTGWWDVDLTPLGEREARRGGELLAAADLLPDVLHTSMLTRAIRTSTLALEACERVWLPVRRDWRLNERHYGDLQGKDKKQVKDEFGEEQFMAWRRSYDTPPPPIATGRGPSASPMWSSGCCRTGRARSCRTLRVEPSWSSRTATRCGRWSSTWRGSATPTSRR